MKTKVHIRRTMTNRWIIAYAGGTHFPSDIFAWTGIRWAAVDENGTPSGGLVHVCNFGSKAEAVQHAQGLGFEVEE